MKLAIPLLILMTSAAASSAASAAGTDLQEQSSPTPGETDTTGRNASEALNALSQRLNLSEDQKSKILPILVERRQKMHQMGAILEDSDKRINAFLSPEQQKSYAIIEQEMKAKLKARHSRTATTSN